MTWLGTWKQRRAFVVPPTNVDSTLTWFALPLFLRSSAGIGSDDVTDIFDELGAEKLKLAVTDVAGTQLKVEIQEWDESGKKAFLWVSHEDWVIRDTGETVVYLYFDVNQADNTSNVGVKKSTPAEAVWDDDYVAVWHLNESISTDADHFEDSTSNDNHGTLVDTGAQAASVAGKIGQAVEFEVTLPLNYIEVANLSAALTSSTEFDLSCWGKPTLAEPVDNQGYCGFRDDTNGGMWFAQRLTAQTEWKWFDSAHDPGVAHSNGGLTDDTWIHLSLCQDTVADQGMAYDNGVLVGTQNDIVIGWSDGTKDFRIGGLDEGGGFPFDGVIDEVRVSKSVRGGAWHKANYYAQDDNIGSWGPTEGITKRLTGDVDHAAGTTVGGADPATLVGGLVPQSQRLWLPPRTSPYFVCVSGGAVRDGFAIPDVGRIVVHDATNEAMHGSIALDEDDIAYDGCDIECWLIWTLLGTGAGPGDQVKWELSIGTWKADGSENVGAGGSWGLTTTKTIDINGFIQFEGHRTLLGTYTGGAVGDEFLSYKILRPAQNWSNFTFTQELVLVRA